MRISSKKLKIMQCMLEDYKEMLLNHEIEETAIDEVIEMIEELEAKFT